MPITKKKTTTKRKTTTEKPVGSQVQSLEERVIELERRLAESWVLSDSFWKRAFGILGSYLAAYLAIAAAMIALVLFALLVSGALAGFVSLMR